jgi:hypothetical protein
MATGAVGVGGGVPTLKPIWLLKGPDIPAAFCALRYHTYGPGVRGVACVKVQVPVLVGHPAAAVVTVTETSVKFVASQRCKVYPVAFAAAFQV